MFILGFSKEVENFNFIFGNIETKKQKLIFFFREVLNEITIEKNNFNSEGYYYNYNGKTKTTFALNPFHVR